MTHQKMLSVDGGYCVMKEGLVDGWDGLHVGGEYLPMSVEVNEEGVTSPSPLNLDYVEGDIV